MLNNGYKLGMNENVALNDYPYFEYYEATLINCYFIKRRYYYQPIKWKMLFGLVLPNINAVRTWACW